MFLANIDQARTQCGRDALDAGSGAEGIAWNGVTIACYASPLGLVRPSADASHSDHQRAINGNSFGINRD